MSVWLVAQPEVAYLVDRSRSDLQVMKEFMPPDKRFYKPMKYEMTKDDVEKEVLKKLELVPIDYFRPKIGQ